MMLRLPLVARSAVSGQVAARAAKAHAHCEDDGLEESPVVALSVGAQEGSSPDRHSVAPGLMLKRRRSGEIAQGDAWRCCLS